LTAENSQYQQLTAESSADNRPLFKDDSGVSINECRRCFFLKYVGGFEKSQL